LQKKFVVEFYANVGEVRSSAYSHVKTY